MPFDYLNMNSNPYIHILIQSESILQQHYKRLVHTVNWLLYYFNIHYFETNHISIITAYAFTLYVFQMSLSGHSSCVCSQCLFSVFSNGVNPQQLINTERETLCPHAGSITAQFNWASGHKHIRRICVRVRELKWMFREDDAIISFSCWFAGFQTVNRLDGSIRKQRQALVHISLVTRDTKASDFSS